MVLQSRLEMQEEFARLQAMQADAAQHTSRSSISGRAEAGRQQRIEDFCAKHTQAVADAKFRCRVCRKLFRGPEFVHKHICEKHLQAGSGVAVQDPEEQQRASTARLEEVAA